MIRRSGALPSGRAVGVGRCVEDGVVIVRTIDDDVQRAALCKEALGKTVHARGRREVQRPRLTTSTPLATAVLVGRSGSTSERLVLTATAHRSSGLHLLGTRFGVHSIHPASGALWPRTTEHDARSHVDQTLGHGERGCSVLSGDDESVTMEEQRAYLIGGQATAHDGWLVSRLSTSRRARAWAERADKCR